MSKHVLLGYCERVAAQDVVWGSTLLAQSLMTSDVKKGTPGYTKAKAVEVAAVYFRLTPGQRQAVSDFFHDQ